ncbi:MAG: hypothetical protein DLM62_05500 [Pseudonocardiales bacterium]|nr:MAG: hypothetical protein DLM62_05500 [Pseudonocardiales bacterium]
MIEPTTAYMVSKGSYDDYRALAVFTERLGALEYACHQNMTSERLTMDDIARVEEIDLYGPGWRRPRGEVLDGEVVHDTSDRDAAVSAHGGCGECGCRLDEHCEECGHCTGGHATGCENGPDPRRGRGLCPGCDQAGGVRLCDSAPGADTWACTGCGFQWSVTVDEPDLRPFPRETVVASAILTT